MRVARCPRKWPRGARSAGAEELELGAEEVAHLLDQGLLRREPAVSQDPRVPRPVPRDVLQHAQRLLQEGLLQARVRGGHLLLHAGQVAAGQQDVGLHPVLQRLVWVPTGSKLPKKAR